MVERSIKKRRRKLLRDLAAHADGRHDVKIPLSEVAPALDIKGFAGGQKFVDRDSPVYEGGSDIAYDFNTLREEGLIEQAYLVHERDRAAGVVYKNPGVKVTAAGLQALLEADKSWLTRAIEKGPMTFLQIMVTVLIAIVTAVCGWLVGRYLTPVGRSSAQPTIVIGRIIIETSDDYLSALSTLEVDPNEYESYGEYDSAVMDQMDSWLRHLDDPKELKALFYKCLLESKDQSETPQEQLQWINPYFESRNLVMYRLAAMKTPDAAEVLVDLYCDPTAGWDAHASEMAGDAVVKCGRPALPFLKKRAASGTHIPWLIHLIESGAETGF